MVVPKRIALVLAAAAVIATAGACGENSGEPGSAGSLAAGQCPIPGGPLAFALSRRANAPGDIPRSVSDIVRDWTATVAFDTDGPPVTVVVVDGSPSVSEVTPPFHPTGESPEFRTDETAAFINQFESAVEPLRAEEPEADVLLSLDKAASVAGRRSGSPGSVVLVDSGLSTIGSLDFSQPGVLDAPPDEVVTFLAAQQEIPDLTGLTVVLVGLGQVAPPQAAPRPVHVRRLVELWTAIAVAGGAACVDATFADAGREMSAPDGVQPVKLVPIPAPVTFCPQCSTVLTDSGEVGFIPGRAEFREVGEARAVLAPFAAALNADPALRLRLTGTTARHGSRESQEDLARQRAETVKAELVGLGANPDQIETRGLGSYFPQYVNDQGLDGVLLPGPAQLNRTVRVDPCRPDCPPDP